jgi:mRNA-degrading endonuclease RelE of RelBE toxin-antitoxin system
MADKIAKLLARLPPKQLVLLKPVITQVIHDDLEGLDVKALKGHEATFRVRVGNYRIIFKRLRGKPNNIILISKRSEKTYKDF